MSVVPSALVIRRWDTGEVIADHPMAATAPTRRRSARRTTACTASRCCRRSASAWRTTGCTSGTAASASRSALGRRAALRERRERRRRRGGRRRRRALRDPPARRRARSAGRLLRHGRLPRARPGRGHAVAPRSDAAAVLGRAAAPPPALRDRRRPHRQLPRRRPRARVDQRDLDGGVRGRRRRRRLRRLAPGRDRDGRRDRGRGALGAASTSRRSSAGTPTASS